MFIQFLWDVFLNLFLVAYVIGWFFVLADYIFSSEKKYRRALRKKLKDKSLSKEERDSIRFELIRREIVGRF